MNFYGFFKLVIECMFDDYVYVYDFGFVVLWYFNVVGVFFRGDIGEDYDLELYLIFIVL